ncbi:alpha/beta fold hydrolase [Paucibacter sp. PLA-PC-4]|uniref:alpha/beta fold hydrolase n=1 Tax=Paucibacter sp. PLA-PC-4 TaxID=2993655 RepID=UPI00224B1C3F|nr:alpha/beta fold hydrolase [Paucibacter sp. PLA-PC-4]MCX2864575.1 alpha/beta fold hydrolase [Paucibacter sp. PLA-PC-4]
MLKKRTAILILLALALFGLAAWAWTPDLPQADLDAKYMRQPSDRVELRAVPGVHLHLRDTGPRSAPALLMIHGFGASLHSWEPWAAALSETYRVIRIDLPGSGLSPPDPSGVYTDARTEQLLLALLDQLEVPHVTLIGHSIGGRIAWGMAARHPERITRLVLIAPDGFASPGFDYGQAPEVPASLKLMTHVLPRPLLRMSLAPAYADPEVLSDRLTERYFELMRAPGARQALLARMQQTVLSDPRPQLQRIKAPTLLIWGEQDAMIPFSNAADYLTALPSARLAALPGIGHLPQEEQPARGLAALQALLRESQ